MTPETSVLDWIQQNGPSLGVSVFFIIAWYLERKDKLTLRADYVRDLRRWANIYRDEDANGDE